ncbi:MAG: hypothetical protein ACU0CO_12665 [Shimia sp.]
MPQDHAFDAAPRAHRPMGRNVSSGGASGVEAASEARLIDTRTGHLPRRASPADPGPGAWPRASEVLFLVPLIARAKVGDWARIEANLARTLGTLIRQTDPRWRAVICCHDVPALPRDPRIDVLSIDRPLDGDDKWAKLTAILRHRDPGPDTLLFPLDADDLLHPGLVAHMLRHPGDGWLVTQGYSMDARTGRLGRHGDPGPAHPRINPLWHACGSAGAVRRVADDIAATRQMLVRHFEMPTMAAAHGQRLRPLPFPGAIYLVAHGENMESAAGREADKLRYIEVNAVPGEEAADVRRLFGLGDGALV